MVKRDRTNEFIQAYIGLINLYTNIAFEYVLDDRVNSETGFSDIIEFYKEDCKNKEIIEIIDKHEKLLGGIKWN